MLTIYSRLINPAGPSRTPVKTIFQERKDAEL